MPKLSGHALTSWRIRPIKPRRAVVSRACHNLLEPLSLVRESMHGLEDTLDLTLRANSYGRSAWVVMVGISLLIPVIGFALLAMQGRTTTKDTGLTIRRVPIDAKILDSWQPRVWEGAVSPNGEWLAHTDDGKQIIRYDLIDGQ